MVFAFVGKLVVLCIYSICVWMLYDTNWLITLLISISMITTKSCSTSLFYLMLARVCSGTSRLYCFWPTNYYKFRIGSSSYQSIHCKTYRKIQTINLYGFSSGFSEEFLDIVFHGASKILYKMALPNHLFGSRSNMNANFTGLM